MKTPQSIQGFGSIIELVRYFDTEEKCAEYLAKKRWNGNPVCPKCGSEKVYTLKGKTKRYKCGGCREQFSVRVGTIFEASPIKLQTWFLAVYLVTAHKKGISSLQLSRDLCVTQKTAWFMLHRIRYAMGLEPGEPLDGTVEIDETYVGGKETNKPLSKRREGMMGGKGKAAVLGMLDRDGDVVAKHVPDTEKKTVLPIIHALVTKGTTICTDEFPAYKSLRRVYDHQTVKHGAEEYVRGAIHTNSIEGFWSLLKRGIIGIYHFTSEKHLQRYVDEFVFRYNSRTMNDANRFGDMLENVAGRLTYKTLTHGKAA
ncbi:MAG: IS1595 family transposase [Bacteroidetes bacterium]|nr:IS1595 family transposase [Bacteroidota bacterium]